MKKETDYFEAISIIQAGDFMMRNLKDTMRKRNPMDIMIDNSCGMNKEYCRQAKVILEDIIEAQDSINIDSSLNTKLLNEINIMLK